MRSAVACAGLQARHDVGVGWAFTRKGDGPGSGVFPACVACAVDDRCDGIDPFGPSVAADPPEIHEGRTRRRPFKAVLRPCGQRDKLDNQGTRRNPGGMGLAAPGSSDERLTLEDLAGVPLDVVRCGGSRAGSGA